MQIHATDADALLISTDGGGSGIEISVVAGNGSGINSGGSGTGSGLRVSGGPTGHGFEAQGGITSGEWYQGDRYGGELRCDEPCGARLRRWTAHHGWRDWHRHFCGRWGHVRRRSISNLYVRSCDHGGGGRRERHRPESSGRGYGRGIESDRRGGRLWSRVCCADDRSRPRRDWCWYWVWFLRGSGWYRSRDATERRFDLGEWPYDHGHCRKRKRHGGDGPRCRSRRRY